MRAAIPLDNIATEDVRRWITTAEHAATATNMVNGVRDVAPALLL
jgi:hypothetical protein